MSRMTRAEAARALGVNKSTIVRWCAQHPALLGDDRLVDLEELKRHRLEHADPSLQTMLGKSVTAMPSDQGSFNEHRARSERARAQTSELDLAERLSLTLRRDDVESAIAEAAEIIKQTGHQLARDSAERLSLIDDPREMDKALSDLVREMLTRGATAIAARIAPDRNADAA